jgi:tetratricopeptide (TPR) repeat protein
MGRERTRQGKLLHILTASLIALVFFGCAGAPEVREETKEETKVPETVTEPVLAVEVEEEPEAVPDKEKQIEETQEDQKRKEEALKQERRAKQITESLSSAKKLLEQGDFDGSLKRSQRGLSLSGRNIPGDEALFTMALVYVHYRNPKKDYAKAIGLFERIPKEYPESHLADQARSWVDVLQVIEKLKKVDIDIEEKKKGLGR